MTYADGQEELVASGFEEVGLMSEPEPRCTL